MKKDCKIPICGIRPDNRPDKVVVGAKQLRRALENGQALQVFLARDADPAMTEPIAGLCRQKGIQPSWVSTRAELGKACGIDVGAAAAAVVKESIPGSVGGNSVEYNPSVRRE